jgi:hypothetical protein
MADLMATNKSGYSGRILRPDPQIQPVGVYS